VSRRGEILKNHSRNRVTPKVDLVRKNFPYNGAPDHELNVVYG